jgi:osmotically-inducible protein OsmY
MYPTQGLIAGLSAAALGLSGGLSGCASIQKCGFRGCPDDQRITASIEGLIKQHPAIEAPNIVRVNTIDHVVYLYGQVETELQRATAESLAHQVPGVRKVIDSINFSYQGL